MSCPDCFRGHVHQGNPTGKVHKIYGRDTYIAEPPPGVDAKGIVVILSDGAGWSFVNTRILADKFASEGPFMVYLPDFLGGHAVPAWVIDPMSRITTEGGVMGWLWKPWYLVKIIAGVLPMIKFSMFNDPWPDIKAWLSALRSDKGRSTPVGVAGYCWGGTYAIRLAHAEAESEIDSGRLADACFAAHPGAMAVPVDAEKVERPLSFAIGDQDMLLPIAKVEVVQKVLEEKKRAGEADTELTVYPGAGHGFGTRGNPADAEGLKHSEAAMMQAIRWFAMHFG